MGESFGNAIKFLTITAAIGILPTLYVLFKILQWVINHVRII